MKNTGTNNFPEIMSSVQQISRTAIICSLTTLVACLAPIASHAKTGTPEYMKMDFKPGITLEIKGEWDSAGVFVASDIETLPKPRSPKLRGLVRAIDRKKETFTIYGRSILLTKDTRFVEVDSTRTMIDRLEVGQQIEVSCKVNDKDEWKARKIKTDDVKKSSKIKGSLTRVAIDGISPDTIEIHGLLILLNQKTDINEPRGKFEEIETGLFKYPGFNDPRDTYAGAQLSDRLLLTGKYRGTFKSESEFDLSPIDDRDQSDTEPSIRAELTGYWGPTLRTFAQARLRKRFVINSDRTPRSTEDVELDITQLYVLLKDINHSGLSVQIGRQDFDEPREWLFDEYLDALRVYYYGVDRLVLQTALIVSIDPIKDKFDPWTDFFAQASWSLDKRNQASAYLLSRQDSGQRDKDPIWWGVRYFGEPTGTLRSWADVSFMRGDDNLKQRSLKAWAFDFGTTFTAHHQSFSTSFTASYAVGSGDKTGGDGVSQEFRQTGYEDNVSHIGGASTVHYYGEVLDPELSNIKILTLGAGISPEFGGSLEALFHSYKQREIDNELTDSDLLAPPAIPLGINDDLGWELDVIASSPKLWERVRLRWTFGLFNPGDAFQVGGKSAILNRLNFDVSL